MRVEEADATKCCLGDDVILRLAKIGIQVSTAGSRIFQTKNYVSSSFSNYLCFPNVAR